MKFVLISEEDIEDQHNIVDKTAWEELVRAYNGGVRLCNDKSYRKKEIKS